MSTIIQAKQLRQIDLGLKVDKAAANIPQSATGTLFTVSGGRVLLTSLVGLVTTQIQGQATTMKIRATPTVGAVNDLSGVIDLNGAVVGSLFSITGLAADVAVLSSGGGTSILRNSVIVAVGTIGATTVVNSTGAMSWSVTYIPYDDGASLA